MQKVVTDTKHWVISMQHSDGSVSTEYSIQNGECAKDGQRDGSGQNIELALLLR